MIDAAKSNSVRILALLTDSFGAGGGIAQYNRDLLRALSQSETVREVVALPRFGGGSPDLPTKITQLPPVASRVSWSLRAVQLARTAGFDVIFCGHLNAAPLAAMLARLSSRPLWIQLHGIEAWAPRGALVRRALDHATLVTAVSRYTRSRLLTWSDIDPARVRVLPNTVGEAIGRRPKPQALVERHGLAGKRVILTVGRLAAGERYKGHDRIIQAMPDVLERCPATTYLIVGSGDDRPRLEAEAVKAGVATRVCFAGQVPGDDLPDYFQLADVFAMPSTGEGFGIVFLEAVAAGVPVIAGNRDGSVDALADGAIGTLIDPESRERLVDALVAGITGQVAVSPTATRRFAFHNFATHVDHLVRTFG